MKKQTKRKTIPAVVSCLDILIIWSFKAEEASKNIRWRRSVAARWPISQTTCWSDACSRDTVVAAASGRPDVDDGGTLREGQELGDKHKQKVSLRGHSCFCLSFAVSKTRKRREKKYPVKILWVSRVYLWRKHRL